MVKDAAAVFRRKLTEFNENTSVSSSDWARRPVEVAPKKKTKKRKSKK